MKRKELAGRVFGRYTVLKWAEKSKNGTSKWLCSCLCGSERIVFATALLSGKSQSCGCLPAEKASERLLTHGHSSKNSGKKESAGRSPTYISWSDMKARCNSKDSKYYGSRGIKYCEKWESFSNFLEDMGERPNGMTLDRIDPDGDYEPNNCRWATARQQAVNKRNAHVVQYKGESLSVTTLCRELGVSPSLVFKRIYGGWDLHTALTKPSQKRKENV